MVQPFMPPPPIMGGDGPMPPELMAMLGLGGPPPPPMGMGLPPGLGPPMGGPPMGMPPGIMGPMGAPPPDPFAMMNPMQPQTDPMAAMFGGSDMQMQGMMSPLLQMIMAAGEMEDDAPSPSKPKNTKKRKKPTLEDIEMKADRLVEFWTPRDDRMDEDLILYRLTAEGTGEGETVTKNTPAVVVDKGASLIAQQNPTIQVISLSGEVDEEAQMEEDFLRWSWERWNKTWRRSQMQSSMRYAMAHYLCLRGWLSARIWYDDNWDETPGTTPIRLKLFDPRQVYPMPGGDAGPLYVIHRYWTTYGEFKDEWEEAAKKFDDKEDDDFVEVTSYWDEWYHGIVAEGEAIKIDEHGFGFVPWVIVTASGSPIRATPDDQENWTREVGPSLFHNIRASYKQLNKVLSQIATQVATAANPPTVYYYDPNLNATPTALVYEPGTTNFLLYDRERVDPLHLSPNPGDVGPLVDALLDDMNRGSLHPILWGQGGTQSGMTLSYMTDAARDSLFGVVESMEDASEDINEFTLTLIRDQHDGPIGFWVRGATGRKVGGVSITPEMIEMVGVENDVIYKNISPKDRATMAQIATMLTKENLIDFETAREDYLGHDNPQLIHNRVMAEMVYKDEGAMKNALIPMALMEQDPEMAKLYLFFHMAEIMAAGQNQGQPGQQPGQPPQAPGLPPTAVAPLAQPGADPMQQALGSALGGAGLSAPPGIAGAGALPLGMPLGI